MTMQQFLTTTVTMLKPVTSARGVRWGFAGLAAVWIASTAAATQVFGDSIVVTSDADGANADGLTLRAAIAQAQSTAEDDVITFDVSVSVIQLTQGALLLGDLFMPPNSGGLMIDGGGNVTLVAGGQSGVMEIQSGVVILTGLAFTNGYTDLGGGLLIWDPADVTLKKSLVSGNYASNEGGGICSIGVLTISDTTVKDNISGDVGGGVYAYGGYGGSMVATNLALWHNAARSGGGGLFNDRAEAMLIDPIVWDNTARNGGGIYNYAGQLSLSGGDFAGNQADRNGNDIYNAAGGSLSGDLAGLDIYVEKPKGGRR